MEIRESRPDDWPGIERLYPEAFPDEDLLPLVAELLRTPEVASLVGIGDANVIAHAAFTSCGITGSDLKIALLGPAAVLPACQGQGLGSAIIRAGLRLAGKEGTRLICVLGDPGYYHRFGFRPERRVVPPYPIPAEWGEAWQSLGPADIDIPGGELVIPPPWRNAALWAP